MLRSLRGSGALTPPVSGFLWEPHAGVFFGARPMSESPRALVFIDGNNWFHSLQDLQIEHRGDLDYAKISRKIVGADTGGRTWVGTRYYIGIVPQDYSKEDYEGQRRFLSRLEKTSPLIAIRRGRLERRRAENKAAKEMRWYL